MICKYSPVTWSHLARRSGLHDERNLTETALQHLFTVSRARFARGKLVRWVCAKLFLETFGKALTCFNNRWKVSPAEKHIYAWTFQHFRWFLLSLFLILFFFLKIFSFFESKLIFFFFPQNLCVFLCSSRAVFLEFSDFLVCLWHFEGKFFNIHTQVDLWEMNCKVLPCVCFKLFISFLYSQCCSHAVNLIMREPFLKNSSFYSLLRSCRF